MGRPAEDAEIEVLSAENTGGIKDSLFSKPGEGQIIATHASTTAKRSSYLSPFRLANSFKFLFLPPPPPTVFTHKVTLT